MRIVRALSRSLLPWVMWVGIGVLVLTIGLTFVVSMWKHVTISGWNIVGAQIARWLAFGLGVYLIHNVLPIAVAHGRTRRELLWQSALFSVVLAAVMAAIARLGFVVETLVYQAMDWSRDSAGAGFLQYWLMFAVWCAVGAFVAAAFDRFEAGGFATIPVGLALIIPVGSLVHGANSLPFIGALPGFLAAQAILVSIGTFLVAQGLTWAIARDMPIRIKTS